MDSSIVSPRRRHTRLRIGAIASASLLLALGATPAAGAVLDPAPATVAGIDDDQDPAERPFTMELADRGIATGSTTTATFSLANETADDFAAGTISISVGDPIGADAVDTWLSGGAASGLEEVDEINAPDVVSGATQSVSATLPLADMPQGVYPVEATYDAGTEPEADRAALVVAGDERGSVSLVVPITGPVTTRGLYASDALAILTSPDGLLTAQLDAVDGTPAILAVDPSIPASIRALGDAAPTSATDWLERLTSLDNDRFALQFADADVTPQIAAGLDAPLAQTHLGAFLDDSAADDDPSLHSLTRIGPSANSTIFWPAPGSAGADTVEALVGDGSARVMVPSSSTTDGSARLGGQVLAYDDALSDALLDAAREMDPDARERALAAATVRVWAAAAERDEPLLLALDRMGSDELATNDDGAIVADTQLPLSASGLIDAVAATTDGAVAEFAHLDDVLSVDGGAVELTETAADAGRVDAVATYLATEPALDHIATALENPDLFTGQVRSELHRILAVTWASNTEGWQQTADDFASLNDDRAVAIDLQDQQPVQLLSAEAPMPVWIRNDLPFTAIVTVVAIPDDPRLSIERRTEVIAQPDSVTRTTIPIEARVGSGDVTVHYTLEARSGDKIGPTRDLHVTVRADWERIGIGILVVVVVGLFGLGIYRQVRRRRRESVAHSDDGIQETDA